jgi:hypothetical protein
VEPTASDSAATHVDLKVNIGRLSFDPHRIIYATIILMTAFSIFDQGDKTLTAGPLATLVAIALAPLFALTMAHAFAEALDLQIRKGRRLTGRDRRHLFLGNLEYMYVAVPPIVVAIVLALFGMTANHVIDVILVLGVLSLAFWGAYAARKARLGVGMQIRFAASYLVMGVIVIVVELLLTH